MSYAQNTSVPVERSKAELDALLARHGAGQRLIGSDDHKGIAFAIFTFGMHDSTGHTVSRQVRLQVPLPQRSDQAFTHKPAPPRATDQKPRRRPDAEAARLWERACRERWRAVVLLVKAKLEAIAIGVSSLEHEFLADMVLPDGRAVYAILRDQLAETYKTGGTPPLLGPTSTAAPARDADHNCG